MVDTDIDDKRKKNKLVDHILKKKQNNRLDDEIYFIAKVGE